MCRTMIGAVILSYWWRSLVSHLLFHFINYHTRKEVVLISEVTYRLMFSIEENDPGSDLELSSFLIKTNENGVVLWLLFF